MASREIRRANLIMMVKLIFRYKIKADIGAGYKKRTGIGAGPYDLSCR